MLFPRIAHFWQNFPSSVCSVCSHENAFQRAGHHNLLWFERPAATRRFHPWWRTKFMKTPDQILWLRLTLDFPGQSGDSKGTRLPAGFFLPCFTLFHLNLVCFALFPASAPLLFNVVNPPTFQHLSSARPMSKIPGGHNPLRATSPGPWQRRTSHRVYHLSTFICKYSEMPRILTLPLLLARRIRPPERRTIQPS